MLGPVLYSLKMAYLQDTCATIKNSFTHQQTYIVRLINNRIEFVTDTTTAIYGALSSFVRHAPVLPTAKISTKNGLRNEKVLSF